MKVKYRIMTDGRTHRVEIKGWLGWYAITDRGNPIGMFSDWEPFKTETDAEEWAKVRWGLNRRRIRGFKIV